MPRVDTFHLRLKPSPGELGRFSLLFLIWSSLLWIGLLLVENSSAEDTFPVHTMILIAVGALILSIIPYPALVSFYFLQRKTSWIADDEDTKIFVGAECRRTVGWDDIQTVRILPHCLAIDTTGSPATETIWFIRKSQARRFQNHYFKLREQKRLKQLEADREAAGGGLV